MKTTSRDILRSVAIIGGGPAGVGCALTMLRGAREQGRELQVLLLEPKQFGRHYNQCAGVVISEQVRQTLAACGEAFPEQLVQRHLHAYVLHAGAREIALEAEGLGNGSCAMRRVEFDQHLLRQAETAGATLLRDRLTDLEFSDSGAIVYTEGATHHVDAVVGAFGLDAGAARVFARRAGYAPPPCLETLVTKVHPEGLEPIEGLLDDRIHAFLPRLGGVEFASLIPKGNHISAIIAGVGLTGADMDRFLRLPEVARLLPAGLEPGDHYRGAFPVGLARRFCGDRYLVIGDAAGLVRPFKGGGINAALATGGQAGRCLLEHGVTGAAAEAYLAACHDLRRDVWYGRRLRSLVAVLSGPLRMEAIIDLANHNAAMRRILYDCVSGRVSYREALSHDLNLPLALRAGWACLSWPLRSHVS